MSKIVRSVGVMSAAVAFGAGSALVAPIAGAQSELPGSSAPGVENCGEQVVTPETLAASGWATPEDETAAVIAAVEGAPESVGDAALTLPTDPADGSSLYKDADRMDLSDLLDEDDALQMNFEYTSEGQAPALQIRLNDASLADSEEDNAGYEEGFATITWSPEPAEGDWEEANPADSDQFWVTRALDNGDDPDIPRGERMSLDRIIDLNSDAVVTEYGVQKTRENSAENVAIDNFTFGCETTNFELDVDSEGSLDDIFGTLTDSLES